MRNRFLGKFPIDLGGPKIFLKIILSQEISANKSNNHFFDPKTVVFKVPPRSPSDKVWSTISGS